MTRRPLLCSLLALALVCSAAFAERPAFPIAKVIVNPGAEYADTARSWQGIPGIERAPKGRLWATWYSGDIGEGSMGNYAMVATSGNDGKTWSKPLLVIEGPKGTSIGDPLPWLDPKGRLWIFYAQATAKEYRGDGPGGRATFAIRTDDPDSANPKWSAPFLVAEGGILFGKPIVRASGGWVAPFFVSGTPSWSAQMNGLETGTLLSTDEGASWQWLGGTSIPKDLRSFSESTLAQRRDGSLWMVVRTSKGLYESASRDDGQTWSEATPLAGFPAAVTRAHLRKLTSGAFLLIFHDSQKAKPGRERLTAWLSDDEGRTWPHKLLLDDRTRLSYPDATQAPDGRIFITYDHGRYEPGEKEILLGIVREEDIRAGKLVSPDAAARLVVNRTYAYGNHLDLEAEKNIAAALPPQDQLRLYLLIGQSNMAGRGLIDPAARLSRLRVLKFSPRNAWAPGIEPLHTDKPAVAGTGLGLSFARALADADPQVTIGLIPCAVGGTPLARWVKGGDLYQQALERARLAMKDGTLSGILWHQGEGDASGESTARSYGERLAQMIADLRADLGAGEVPFVAGQLGEFLARENKDGQPNYWPVVNEQLAALPARVPRMAVVPATGLKDKGDGVHFDTPSLRAFGERYARAMRALQAK